MRRILALAALGLALAACRSAPAQIEREPIPPQPSSPLPPAQSGFETAPDAKPADPGDQCGARRLQWLIGRPRTDIPVPVEPDLRRVTCTQCPMTMDFNARRLNILFDEASGIVKEVKCG